MSEQAAVKVEQAVKTFGVASGGWIGPRTGARKATVKVAVDRVSLEIQRGEIFGVLGPNGSGKSTLIRLIATLLLPDNGRIAVFGRDVVAEARAVQTLINRVSVEASFFKKLSPMENLLYGARLYGVPASTARQRVVDILTRLGLEARAIYNPMEEMSRGMQQKVAIARAFLSQPILLLLDEPTTGLDPRSKREVQAFVRELRDTHDATILLTTHDMLEAEALCDRIAIIDGGRIVALDTPAGLKQRISHNSAARPVPRSAQAGSRESASGGHAPTLEDVFLELTGKQLVTDEET